MVDMVESQKMEHEIGVCAQNKLVNNTSELDLDPEFLEISQDGNVNLNSEKFKWSSTQDVCEERVGLV